MKNVLKYPGSKTRIAKWIASFIPPHDVYLEPFFGGGAVGIKEVKDDIDKRNC